jgi:hypothetical protein
MVLTRHLSVRLSQTVLLDVCTDILLKINILGLFSRLDFTVKVV